MKNLAAYVVAAVGCAVGFRAAQRGGWRKLAALFLAAEMTFWALAILTYVRSL